MGKAVGGAPRGSRAFALPCSRATIARQRGLTVRQNAPLILASTHTPTCLYTKPHHAVPTWLRSDLAMQSQTGEVDFVQLLVTPGNYADRYCQPCRTRSTTDIAASHSMRAQPHLLLSTSFHHCIAYTNKIKLAT
jgi:hypothetical protein